MLCPTCGHHTDPVTVDTNSPDPRVRALGVIIGVTRSALSQIRGFTDATTGTLGWDDRCVVYHDAVTGHTTSAGRHSTRVTTEWRLHD
jgi:hypothetical protein